VKSAEEIMNMLEAFDLTGSLRDAGELAGVSHHTVARYVAAREAGGLSDRPAARPQLIDEHLAKLEEWIERSRGKLRADKAHEKLLLLGYAGSERTTRRAVAAVKRNYRLGRVRVHRPWVTEPGMWLQYDFGDGPLIEGVKTTLFVAWLAWSRFRVVLAIRDKTGPSVMAALDVTLRRLGGAPTYVLTDNEKTVTTEHVAGIAVRNPAMVDFARFYGVTVHTCQPCDPASKGGSESSVKIAKADLVPKDTNLLSSSAPADLTRQRHQAIRRIPGRATVPTARVACRASGLSPVRGSSGRAASGVVVALRETQPTKNLVQGRTTEGHGGDAAPIQAVVGIEDKHARLVEPGQFAVLDRGGDEKTPLPGGLLSHAVRHGQPLQLPGLDQFGTALGRLHAHRNHASDPGRADLIETPLDLAELLATHRAMQATEEQNQREPAVNT